MKEKISIISLFVNIVLTVSKILIGVFSNSMSVLADGMHSGMDILSSAINLIGLRQAKKPVDEEHPYGHYKYEVLSGLLITVILFITGIGIVYGAYKGFLSVSKIHMDGIALAVMVFSAIINEIMARLKIYYGKSENSISLLADGVHSRIDVWTSTAVVIGLLLRKYWVYTDPLIALLIGLYIIIKSFSLGKETTDSLLDSYAGAEIEDKIRKIVKDNAIEISELKTQKKGLAITVNVKIKLPNNLSVEKATLITDNLKKKLMDGIKNLSYVAVQIENYEYSTSYFKPTEIFSFRRGFGWQRRWRPDEGNKETFNKKPVDFCICIKCGFKEEHKRGVPCSSVKCQKCGNNMTREGPLNGE